MLPAVLDTQIMYLKHFAVLRLPCDKLTMLMQPVAFNLKVSNVFMISLSTYGCRLNCR